MSESTPVGVSDNTPVGVTDNTPVGVVGLGLVGRALSLRLVQAGWSLVGWDRDASARRAWARAIGTAACAADSLSELAQRCTQHVLAVFDTAGVLRVVEGAGGLLNVPAVGRAPCAIIDCSTGEPEALQGLATRLAARGVDFIEAPLSGSSQQIAAGGATMLLGATVDALDRHAALLAALSIRRVHVGGAGMGARAKLATNLVLGLNRAALAEGMAFAVSQGIAPAAFLQLVLATPARSDAAVNKGELMLQLMQGDVPPAQSRIAQHLKDLGLMLAAAEQAGQRLPLTQTHAALLRSAVAAGDGELDNAAIVRQLLRQRGVPD